MEQVTQQSRDWSSLFDGKALGTISGVFAGFIAGSSGYARAQEPLAMIRRVKVFRGLNALIV